MKNGTTTATNKKLKILNSVLLEWWWWWWTSTGEKNSKLVCVCEWVNSEKNNETKSTIVKFFFFVLFEMRNERTKIKITFSSSLYSLFLPIFFLFSWVKMWYFSSRCCCWMPTIVVVFFSGIIAPVTSTSATTTVIGFQT